jgi:ABC-type cobalamin/Fe3+-siderophores transport system ATPase subunit
VLDEATSALDPDGQDKLMELLTTELDATTIVSVGHRPELEAFHSRKIVLERQRGGCPLRHRHQFDSAARPQTPLGTMAAGAAGAGKKDHIAVGAVIRARETG